MLEKFKDWLLINGSAWLTTRNYIGRMEQVLAKLPEEKFSADTLTAFLREVQIEHSVSTVNGYICALTAYLKFTKKEIILPKFLKGTKTLPQSIDELQLEQILNVLSQVLKRDYLKFRALLYMLFYTGIRIGEIDNLHRKDFNLDEQSAKILVTKTREERIVVYIVKVKDALKEYFNSEEEVENAFNINSNAVQQRFKDFKQYFPNLDLHPHVLRHSFAVYCLRNGVDVLTVSKLMGHKNIQTTERYLALTPSQFQEIYFNKLDNKEGKIGKKS